MSDGIHVILFFSLTMTVAFGLIGFNRPSWSRTYTTAFRYWAALVGHIALYIAALVLFVILLRRGFQAGGLSGSDLTLASLLAAFGAIACLRSIPYLARWPRRMLHRAAGIPSVAIALAERLTELPVVRRPDIENEARSILLNRGIDAECDWLPGAQQVHQQLLNATVLFIQLRNWEHEGRYAAFLSEARNEFDRLRQEFDRVSFRFARAVGHIERLGKIRHLCTPDTSEAKADIDEHFRKLVKDIIASVSEDVGVFYLGACKLLVRGVMTTRLTNAGRVQALARVGFENVQHEVPHWMGVLLTAAVLLYLGMWLLFLIQPADPGPLDLQYRIALITLIVVGSLAAAIVPKLHWGFANAGLRDRTPVAFVIGAGVAAMLFAVVVNLVAGFILLTGSDGAMIRLREGLPWLPAAFMTAATMAWLIQDHRWHKVSSRRGLLDATMLGAVWIVQSSLAQYIRGQMEMQSNQNLWVTLAGSFVLGAVIGYAIPGSVRVEYIARPRYPTAQRATGLVLGTTGRPATST